MKKFTLLFIAISLSGFAQTAIPFYAVPNSTSGSFGQNLDTNGINVLTSDFGSPFPPTGSPHAYMYEYSSGTLQHLNTWTPDDIIQSDGFGEAVSLDNEFAAVGAAKQDGDVTDKGAVYIYRKTGGNWNFFTKLTASDGEADDRFGSFVKLNGNSIYISAINPLNESAVYVYRFDGISWNFSEKIEFSSPSAFGGNILVDGTKVVITQRLPNEYSMFRTYSDNGITLAYEHSSPNFGDDMTTVQDVSFSNGKLFLLRSAFAVGHEVLILEETATEWIISDSFPIDDPDIQPGDMFYSTVVVENDKMFLGCNGYILAEQRNFPVVYYKFDGSTWQHQSQFFGIAPELTDDFFGRYMALKGNLLVMSEYFGRAYYLDTETLATENFNTSTFSIYPNPVTNMLNIGDGIRVVQKVTLSSLTGQLLLTKFGNTQTLNLENLSSGVYLLNVESENGNRETFKIVKQ